MHRLTNMHFLHIKMRIKRLLLFHLITKIEVYIISLCDLKKIA